MRRILLCILSAMLCVPFYAQDDPVVIKVNGKDVKQSEFEYYFRKNNTETNITRKTIKQYADLYVNFKLKVQAAIDEGLDKSESFIDEYKMYRGIQAESYLIDSVYLENAARRSYEQTYADIGPDGLAYMCIITSVPKEPTEEAYHASLDKIRSVYQKLLAGEDFREMARQYSEDEFASSGGVVGWVSKNQLPMRMGDVVFELDSGKFSEPILTDELLMIVRVLERRDIGSYEDNRDEIYRYLHDESEAYWDAMVSKANGLAANLGWDVRDSAAVAYMDSKLEELEPEFANISREYYDGLLVFDISNKMVWEKASIEEDLEAYYKSHIKEFKFSEPCFKGMVFFCRNEDVFHSVEKVLDGVEIQNWIDTILANINKGGDIKVRVMRGSSESGVFHKGQNACVDKLVFGEGEFEPMNNYPYVDVIGKVLKEPECMSDVADQVSESYQKYLEKQWVKKLRKQYKYKIYKKALKKVSL